MKPVERRRAEIAAIEQEALDAWRNSGLVFTCLAVVHDVTHPVIQRRCAQSEFTLRWRMISNRVDARLRDPN